MDEERWKIEGRTRDALRQAKHRAGLLRADIAEHAQKLRKASEALLYYVSDPAGAGPTGRSKCEYIVHFYGAAVPATIEAEIRELASETERIRDLEKQIAEF